MRLNIFIFEIYLVGYFINFLMYIYGFDRSWVFLNNIVFFFKLVIC